MSNKQPSRKSLYQRVFSPMKHRSAASYSNSSAYMVASSKFNSKPISPAIHQALATFTAEGNTKTDQYTDLKIPATRGSILFQEFKKNADVIIQSKGLTSIFEGTYEAPTKLKLQKTLSRHCQPKLSHLSELMSLMKAK